MCGSRKYPYPPPPTEGIGNIPEGWGGVHRPKKIQRGVEEKPIP